MEDSRSQPLNLSICDSSAPERRRSERRAASCQAVAVTANEGEPAPIFWTDDSPRCASLVHGEGVAAHFHDFGQLRYAASGVLVTVTETGTWMAPANRIT